jgi:hypothetical protein
MPTSRPGIETLPLHFLLHHPGLLGSGEHAQDEKHLEDRSIQRSFPLLTHAPLHGCPKVVERRGHLLVFVNELSEVSAERKAAGLGGG